MRAAGFLAAGFFAAGFLAAGFFAAAGFLAAGFLAGAFGFSVAGFVLRRASSCLAGAAFGFGSAFGAAGLRVSIFTSVTSSRVSSERWPARLR